MRSSRLHALAPVLLLVLAAVLIAPGAVRAEEPAAAANDHQLDASTAFDRIKTLAGTWDAALPVPGAEAMTSTHEFRVSAAGTVVMEIMGPGSDHEMINMYHVDGDELLLTHYCAGGNQPTMRLDRATSDADHYVFAFTGGTNLDPATDGHIHGGELTFTGDGTLDSTWIGWSGGKQADTMTFQLTKAGS